MHELTQPCLEPTEVGFLTLPTQSDEKLRMAVASYLAKYKGRTLDGYRYDLIEVFFAWCADPDHHVEPLEAKRGHIELYIRSLEQSGWASATIAKRYDTVRGFYRAADRDEFLPGKDPCTWVDRPKVDTASQRRTVLNPVELSVFLKTASRMGIRYHALAAILGVSALRIAEACSLNIEDMTVEDGYEVLHFIGKGNKPASVPLPVPMMKVIREAIDDRTEGPILTTKWKTRMTPTTARRMVIEIATRADVNTDISPHSLRRSCATAASHIGVGVRDIQKMLRHANVNTTGIYIRDDDNYDRNSSHRVAAFVSGMAR